MDYTIMLLETRLCVGTLCLLREMSEWMKRVYRCIKEVDYKFFNMSIYGISRKEEILIIEWEYLDYSRGLGSYTGSEDGVRQG